MPSRREVLVSSAGTVAGLAGCITEPPGSPSTTGGYEGDRPTATARDPEPLDATGAWPQRGGDPGHAGATDSTGVPESGRVHWQLRRVRSGPAAVGGGRLFHYAKLGEDRGGQPTVTRTRPPDAGTAHPVFGVPYLVARDPSEGRIQWATELPDPARGWPAVGDGLVVASIRERVAAYDVTDGAERWAHDLGARPVGEPTIAGDTVVLPLSGVVDGATGELVHEPLVRAYSLDDGSERWTAKMPARGLAVAVAGDTVVAVSHDYDAYGTVLALSLADGGERWRAEGLGGFLHDPVIAAGTVYVSDIEGTMHAIALADGGERWTNPDGGEHAAATADAVYTGGRRLTAVDPPDGSVRWTVESDEGSFTAPAVGRDAVYAGGNWTDLLALNPADGSERWSHGFPTKTVEGDMVMKGLAAQPTVLDGGLYAFAVDGLYAFGPA